MVLAIWETDRVPGKREIHIVVCVAIGIKVRPGRKVKRGLRDRKSLGRPRKTDTVSFNIKTFVSFFIRQNLRDRIKNVYFYFW